jgi:hypothetical protein
MRFSRAKATKTTAAKPSDTRRILRLLNRFVVGQHRLFVLGFVLLLAEAVSAVLQAYPLAYLIDYLKGDRPDLAAVLGLPMIVSPLITTIAILTIGIVLTAMINSLADSTAKILLAKGGRRLGYNLRPRSIASPAARWHFTISAARAISARVTGDVTALRIL